MSLRSRISIAGLILLTCVGCQGEIAPTVTVTPSVIPLTPTESGGFIPLATPTNLPPTPTETLLPVLELPTPESSIPVIEAWIGEPTYQDSQPDFLFRIEYDASLWALAEDEMGILALTHREIPYCKIVPAGGRGVPRGWTVDDQFRYIGTIQYEVVTASQNGVVQFVNYFGGDGVILMGFQVSFQEQGDECLRAAEVILATLSSVGAPTPTPTLTPTETETPTLTIASP